VWWLCHFGVEACFESTAFRACRPTARASGYGWPEPAGAIPIFISARLLRLIPGRFGERVLSGLT
jgi:hypothetical protein